MDRGSEAAVTEGAWFRQADYPTTTPCPAPATPDRELGILLDKLDREVGRGNYVVALTADHGVSPVPERMKARGFDAGRIITSAVGRAIDSVLVRELGGGPYRTRAVGNDIYFNDGVYL